MKFKKLMALLCAGLMAVSLAACGGNGGGSDEGTAPAAEDQADEGGEESEESSEKVGGTHIYVLTAAEDHGWTGSVATFAKEKVEEVNGEGTYSAEVITSANANEQITKLEDIVASGEKDIAVVIQPMDDTVQSAIQQLVDAEIPFVAFDRIIDAVSAAAVSNVKGDNQGIGAGAAAYFVENGMKPGDKVYVYEGDTSSVTTFRDGGFTEYLTGLRIEKARQLLLKRELSIKQVCVDSGYSDPNYFSRVFKKWTGLTPTEFRDAPARSGEDPVRTESDQD